MAGDRFDIAALNLDLSGIDPATLKNEEDFHQLARRLVPTALITLGEKRGEKTWEDLERDSKRSNTQRPHNSEFDRKLFIRESGLNYNRQAPAKDRKMLEDLIVAYLKATILRPPPQTSQQTQNPSDH